MRLPPHFRIRAPWLAIPFVALLSKPTVMLLGAGAIITIVGLVIRGWAAGTIHKNTTLTTGGPYAFTRNPLYLGSFLIGVGIATATGSIWLFALFLVFFSWVYRGTIQKENRYLEQLYGDRFRSYAEQVPAFVPRLTPFRPDEPHPTAFSMDRYLRNREWEAALGVVAGFGFLAAKLLWK